MIIGVYLLMVSDFGLRGTGYFAIMTLESNLVFQANADEHTSFLLNILSSNGSKN